MAKGNNSSSGRRSSSRNTKPYDANNSFVKKVATKVTDFIPQRSWISKWFNSSQNEEDVLDDNENHEEIESEEDMQKPPPSKRPCIRMDVTHPPGTFSIQPRAKQTIDRASPSKQYSMNNEMPDDFSKPVMAGPSGMSHLISSTPTTQSDIRNITSQRSELNSLVATTSNGTANGMDDNSESSESTSGCSSLIPQTNRQEAPSNVSYNSSFSNRKRFHDEKLSFTNHMQSPRSLFLDNITRDTLSSRRPSFNASIMTNTPDRASPLASPFYTGNITYGGANAAGLYKRDRNLFNSTNEIQLKVPKRTNVEVKPSNAAGVDSSGMSQTAKKILEALEHFSSPITDAKKIPLKMMDNTSLIDKKRSREEGTRSSTKIGLRHLTRELTVPTVPDILKMKRRQKLQDTTAAARKIVSARNEAPPPQEYHIRTQNNEDSKRLGKVKTKTVDLEEEETVEPVNLPNIPLPISSLPNFNFMAPINSKTADKTKENKEEIFTFASPIKVTNTTKVLKSINNFTFSSPINPEKQSSDISHQSSTKSIGAKPSIISSEYISPVAQNFMWTRSSTAPRPKEKVKDSETAVSPSPKELKSGTVMDVLGCKPNTIEPEKSSEPKVQLNVNKEPTNHKINIPASNVDDNVIELVNSKSSTQANTSNMWECSECLFKNNNSETQCFACKVTKPSLKEKKATELTSTSSNVSETKTTVNDNFGSQFKLSTNQWECTSCLVRNKHTDTKCVACSALKPGKKPEIKSDVTKSEMPKAVNDKQWNTSWECTKCKFKNSANFRTCLTCSTPKSALSETTSQEENNKSSAASNSKSEVIDKVKPSKDTWECPCCMVRNVVSTDTCPSCNTAKPIIGTVVTKNTPPVLPNGFGDKFKKPEGSWDCDTCMVQNKGNVNECVACGGLKPGTKKANNSANTTSSNLQFTFGMPANVGNFKFGIDKAGPEKTDSASTNGFKFGDTQQSNPTGPEKTDSASTNGFKFGDTQQSNPTGQFTFGIQKEEKTLNDVSKSDNNAITTEKSGFVFQTTSSNVEKPNIIQDTEKTEKKVTPLFTFGMPKTERVTLTNDKEPVNTVAPTAPSSTFTFGASKSNIATSDTKIEKEGSFIENPLTNASKPPTIARTSTVMTSVSTLPSITQSSSQEIKPAATFSFGVPNSTATIPSTTSSTVVSSLPSSTQSSFTFVESKSTAQTAPAPTFGAINTTAPTSNLTNTFTFGESKATDGSSTQKTFGALPHTPSSSSLFSNISNSPSLFNNNDTNAAPNFGQTSTEGNKQPAFPAGSIKLPTFAMPGDKIPSFSSPEINKIPSFSSPEIKPSIFRTPDMKMPVFGNAENKTSLFNPTPQAPTSATPAPISFGTPSATPNLFGSSITPVFGNNAAPTFATESTPNIFGTTTSKPNETTSTPNSNLFTFGTSAQQTTQPAAGFNFSTNTNPAESAQKPLFTFGSSSTTPQSGNMFGNLFNNPTSTNSSAFTFNAPKPEATAFAQSAAPSPIFGASQPATQNQASSFPTVSENTGFNFGSTAPATSSGGFNFGAAPSSAPSTGFNFNSSSTTHTFDPNCTPSFNFTGGKAPATFSGVPTAARKARKASRRIR